MQNESKKRVIDFGGMISNRRRDKDGREHINRSRDKDGCEAVVCSLKPEEDESEFNF